MKIKKFNQFNSSEWIGPLEILDIKDITVYTNFGNFMNKSGSKLTKGYSYLLRVVNDEIVETGMSCVDLIVLIHNRPQSYKILSIKRGHEPFAGMWANPGGNIDEGEKPIDAAVRELEEETGLKLDKSELQYIGMFDDPFRDPRNKNCVSYAFLIVLTDIPKVTPGDDAVECTWNDVNDKGKANVEMAFDHAYIIKCAIDYYQSPDA